MADHMFLPLDDDDILSKINYLHAMLHVFFYSFNSKIQKDGEFKLIFIDTRNVLKKKKPRY